MGKFGDQLKAFQLKTEGLTEQVVRKAILDVYARLVLRSPVDQGRFRAAWSYGADAIVVRESAPVAEGAGVLSPPEPPVFVNRVIGRVHYIANNLPYAQALENGSSKQAPQGMVKLTAAEWPQIVRAAVRATPGGLR